MKLLRLLMYPFCLIYWVILAARHFFYDTKILKSTQITEPGICVGNLSFGGTGKTPLTTYLLKLLSEENRVAHISRGYKRNSSGFILADENASVDLIGDESFLQYLKFPNAIIAVDSDRASAYQKLKTEHHPDVFLLDDAFQHRKISAGMNILLSTYCNPFYNDHLIPSGNLRDIKSRKKAADIIIISKCPDPIEKREEQSIRTKLKLKPRQQLYFTGIDYGPCYSAFTHDKINPKNKYIFLITAIADAQPIIDHLKKENNKVKHLKYPDHYDFKKKDWDRFSDLFNSFAAGEKMALCTEKDLVKLNNFLESPGNNIPLFAIPMEINWFGQKDKFDQSIRSYVRENK